MEWAMYGVLFLVAVAISVSAVYGFVWALKQGQLRDFDAQARSIFDESEPEGVQTDFFPGKAPRKPTRSPGLSGNKS
jgi:cbb3-type cytochrome oxidase maturation protein